MDWTRKAAVGVDIGGTNLKLGLVAADGKLLDFETHPLQKCGNQNADVSAICGAVASFIEKCGGNKAVSGIGAACPGILNASEGIVKYAVNLGWKNLDLAQRMEQALGFEVAMIGDAAAAAFGEKYATAKKLSNYLYIGIGTGVGASLVVDNEFYKGDNGEALNLGHCSVIPDGPLCDCGNRGCLEFYVSSAALKRHALAALEGLDLRQLEFNGSGDRLESFHVYEAASRNDPLALKLFRDAGQILGIALVNCIQMFGVHHIIVGGGMSQAGDFLLKPARQEVAARFGESYDQVHIYQSDIPTQAGVLGAAAHWFETASSKNVHTSFFS